MKLDAWLRQDRSLDERLCVVERLGQAVNEIHDRGEALAALEPSRVEVDADGHCDLSPARRGSPASVYTAPDREAGAPLAAADVYAAGAIAWEVLAGRSPRRPPRHLAEVRPDLPRELADAVMACVEGSAEWRPKDLTYLAQMAAARQKRASRPAETPRAPLPPRVSTPRPGGRRPSRRTWPLLVALVVVVVLGVVAGRQFLQPGADGVPGPPPPSPPTAAPSPTPRATPAPATEPVPSPEAAPQEARAPLAPTLTAPPPAPTPAEVRQRPDPLSVPPRALEPAPPPDPTPAPAPVSVTLPQPPPRQEADAAEARPHPPHPPPPRASSGPPAALTAVSPLEVRRPGKVLIDLHGSGFGPQHRAVLLPVKKVPWGIVVVRQKIVHDALITILVELGETAEAGEYALAVEDTQGARTEPKTFRVTE